MLDAENMGGLYSAAVKLTTVQVAWLPLCLEMERSCFATYGLTEVLYIVHKEEVLISCDTHTRKRRSISMIARV
jgi:hypothetical protein